MSSLLTFFIWSKTASLRRRRSLEDTSLEGYSRSRAGCVPASSSPWQLQLREACLVAHPWCQAADHLPKRLLGIPPGLCFTSLHTHHPFPQTAVTKTHKCWPRQDWTCHTCWASPRKGLQRTDWRVHMRAGHGEPVLWLCASPGPQLLSKPATVSRKKARAVICLWEKGWKASCERGSGPLFHEGTWRGITFQEWRFPGLLLLSVRSMWHGYSHLAGKGGITQSPGMLQKALLAKM